MKKREVVSGGVGLGLRHAPVELEVPAGEEGLLEVKALSRGVRKILGEHEEYADLRARAYVLKERLDRLKKFVHHENPLCVRRRRLNRRYEVTAARLKGVEVKMGVIGYFQVLWHRAAECPPVVGGV